MALNASTQRILKLVEEISGKPVVVQADPSMRLATMKLGRGTAPAHLLRYNPSNKANADYGVCFQCGFALRIFSAEESNRFDVQVSPGGRKEAETLFAQHLQKKGESLPASFRSQLIGQLYDGLILQLRSMPIAMRVDAWLRRECPELIDQQKSANVLQLNENAASLRPEVRQISPGKICQANVAMNAAFAAFWSRTWDDPLLVVPYKTSATLNDGLALLKLWDEIPDDSNNDKQIIQTWADKLGLNGWFDFIPYE